MKKTYPRQVVNWSVEACRSKIVLFWFLLFGSENFINAQETVISFTSTTNFTVPNGVSSLKVECWGAGGKGSNVSLTATGTSGGGGGGAFASAQLCVVPGQNFAISIGTGGSGLTLDGGDTYFGNATTVMAKGGKGLASDVITGAMGGLASASVGTTKYNGGNGGNRTTYNIAVALGYRSGAGGGGAGSTGIGNNASGLTPGASRIDNGGAGGAGQDGALLSLLAGFSGNSGNNYGAGGSGAGKGLLFSQPTYLGGNGASGIVRITYEAYSCNASANTIWNGTTWSTGVPNNCKKAIINGNYATATNGSIVACSVQINAGYSLTIGEGTYIQSYNEITNNGNLVVANNASLHQQYSAKSNTGMVRIYRHTKPMYRYDYTYWSSPVAETTLDGLSPGTLFDKYAWWNATTQAWVYNPYGAEVMVPGKGYIIRAPQSYSVNPTDKTIFEGVFVGTPNNGTISYPVSGDATGNKYNLLGNPYPSAISALGFLAANNTTLGGTIYFWTHTTTPVNSGGTLSYLSDYATYNFSGGTAIGSGPIPGNKIGSGQSFFVAGMANGSATFTNAMRLLNDNSQFYRPSFEEENLLENIEKHRFWLSFSSNQVTYNQILLGYIENATDDLDWGYDGESLSNSQISLYSLLDQKKLAIQAKALPFNKNDVVKLGYKTSKAGNFNIALNHFDGLFEGNQEVFIKDNLLNVLHDLKEGDYSFESPVGTFENRFEITYSNQALETENLVIDPDSIILYKDKNTTIIINAGSLLINQIKVYDIAGRLLYHQDNVNSATAYVQNLPEQQQLLIVEVLTNDNRKTAKKIIH